MELSSDGFNHIPVLLNEVVREMKVKENGIYADGTLGGGGHAEAILSLLGDEGRYIGIDQDEDALSASKARLAKFGNKFTQVRDNYENMKLVLENLGIKKADGILLDLGVSSFQFDTAERGFSYRMEAPLDMRMDNRMTKTASDIVNGYSREELTRIIKVYGEDRFAANIAKHIVLAREKNEIRTTTELAEIIKQAVPAKFRTAGHPAKQSFQAIRIELNRELEVLEHALDDMVDLLKPGGRLCIITFHSLEDRMVKTAFKKYENPCTCPPNFPVCVCGAKSKRRVVTRKPILPGEEELSLNRRSASAKLRVFERS